MSKKREYDEEQGAERSNPYDEIPQDEYDDDMLDPDDEGYEDDGEEEERGGFLSSTGGRIVLGVIVALLIILLALIVVRVFRDRSDGQQLPSAQTATQAPVSEATQAPGTIVFAPAAQETATPEPTQVPVIMTSETAEPTQAPVIVSNTPSPSPTPSLTPSPTPTAVQSETPLPIILTNTPTPSPSPTPTPTPSPSPTLTATPKPTATPKLDLGTGETNRDAYLRETATSNGKIKQTVKKGQAVTIHEALLDKNGKVWYAVTVDDLAAEGYMRDYVVDTKDKIAAPTATPKVTATPKPGTTAQPTATPNPDAIGTGTANRDANIRKVMNGTVLTTIRKGKAVDILSVQTDKNGSIWYEVQVQGSSTKGYARDYVIDLDKGVDLGIPTPTPKPTATPKATLKPETSTAGNAADGAEARTPIGTAKTNRAANVRVAPSASAKLVRQLSQGNTLNIFARYKDDKGLIWYEVATESGKTQGFVRDYVVNVISIDKDAETLTYEAE